MNKPKKVKGIDPNFDYKKYWEARYANGRNSGAGSYGKNAEFKAQQINRVLEEYACKSIVDFGCGDGNQISLIKPVEYLGLDISPTVIDRCKKKFSGDKKKSFSVYEKNVEADIADLSMCLDVLFHVTKEEDWLATVFDVCRAARKAIVFVTNAYTIPSEYFPHVNYKRRILPILDKMSDVVIQEVVEQPTDKETSVIILSKE